MVFHLSGKVVALHLDNCTAKAYLCNQGGTVSPFLSRLACWILSLTDKHGITLLPAYIPTHLNLEADFLSKHQLLLEWHLLPQMSQVAFHLWGLSEVDLLASSHSTQCQHYSFMRQHQPVCAKTIFSWVRKVLSVGKARMYLDSCWGVAASAALVAGVSLVIILQAGDWTRVSTPARHYLSTYITTTDLHQDSMQHAVLGLSE